MLKSVDLTFGFYGISISALHFLQQAENYFSVGNIVRGVELLKLVNIEATKAWNTTSSSRDTSSDSADDLVICLKLLVLADIVFESIYRDKSNTIRGIFPIYQLDSERRGNISVHVTSHLKTLIKKLGITDFDCLMGMCTKFYSEERSADKDYLQQLSNDCMQWLILKIVEVDEDTIEVYLPIFTNIPFNSLDNRESTRMLNMRIYEDLSNSPHYHSLSVWRADYRTDDLDKKTGLFIGFHGVIYSCNLNEYGPENEDIIVTIRNKKIVDISPGTLLDTPCNRDLTKSNFRNFWRPEDVQVVAAGVVCGDITEVENFTLEAEYYRCYAAKPDLMKVEQVLPVVKKSFVLVLTPMLERMGVEYMRMLGDRVADLETMSVEIANSEIYEAEPLMRNWTIGKEVEGFEFEIGRLLTRAKTGVLKTSSAMPVLNFNRFVEGVAQGLEEERKGQGDCEAILVQHLDSLYRDEHRDLIADLVERIGWNKDGLNGGTHGEEEKVYSIVIVR